MLQRTRPQTLAYALTDSPVGQLAWIAERFKDWTDSRDAPEDAVDRDQLLTNVMLYWLTRTAGSSARLYYETAHDAQADADPPTDVPTGMLVFPRDLIGPGPAPGGAREPDRPLDAGRIAAVTSPGWSSPSCLTDDIRTFFREVR